MSTSPDEATTSATPVDDDVVTIATEIWSELEASSTVEPPFLVKPFYNEMCKKEDKTDFKRPLEMTSAKYLSVTPKLNWNATVKYVRFGIYLSLARSIQARVAKKSELIQLFLHYTSSVGSRRETTGTVVKFLCVYVGSWLYGRLNICV
jgi:hypothetical protein